MKSRTSIPPFFHGALVLLASPALSGCEARLVDDHCMLQDEEFLLGLRDKICTITNFEMTEQMDGMNPCDGEMPADVCSVPSRNGYIENPGTIPDGVRVCPSGLGSKIRDRIRGLRGKALKEAADDIERDYRRSDDDPEKLTVEDICPSATEGCVIEGCADGFVCNEDTGECVADCTVNTGACGGDTPACEASTGLCRPCTDDDPGICSDSESCEDNMCVSRCVPACEEPNVCAQVGGEWMCVPCEPGECGCTTNEDCTDLVRPFCDQELKICVPCGDLPDGDAACAELDSGRPACGTDGGCALCSATQLSACEQPTPVCVDGACADCLADSECPEGFQCSEDNTCLCDDHGDCGEAACNLFTGVCLPTNAEVINSVVHAGPGQDFERLDDAVASFGPGAAGTIIVHLDNVNFGDQAVIVDEDRVLAFLANEGELPRWILGGGGSPHLTVLDGTVLMDGLRLSGNGDDLGIVVDGGRAWIDRSRIVQNDGGGILVQSNANLTLRNSFVGSLGDVVGVEINNASAEILYSTVAASTFGTTPALGCTSPATVSIRNSIVVTQGGTPPDELDCDDATVITSAIEADIAMPFDSGWFVDFNGGDYTLTSAGNDVFGGIASWQVGDPPTDINGDLRPTDKGPDDAGADIFP